MHPDWQLCLDAVYAAVAQPRFPGYELFNKTDRVLDFSKLVQQLLPNFSAQLTAAAIMCRLHACQVADRPQDPGMYRLAATAVAAGEFDAAMTAMCSVLVVSLHIM